MAKVYQQMGFSLNTLITKKRCGAAMPHTFFMHFEKNALRLIAQGICQI